MVVEFTPWPKVARLNRDIVITEKIDGTNAAVVITEEGEIAAQSRTRLITPKDDNFGFAKWVEVNKIRLSELLGPGIHFGEWWGNGIQRGYGLQKNDKRFSLFRAPFYYELVKDQIEGLSTVPILYEGIWSQLAVDQALGALRAHGSYAVEFDKPEGIVIWHDAARTMFKVTLEKDEAPKSMGPRG